MQHETLLDEWSPGDLFVKSHRTDPSDPMALYRFDGWNAAPASSTGGRLADATWMFNGTPSGSWERDMVKPGPMADGKIPTTNRGIAQVYPDDYCLIGD